MLVGCSIHPKKETEVRGETCEKWVRMFEREIELTSTWNQCNLYVILVGRITSNDRLESGFAFSLFFFRLLENWLHCRAQHSSINMDLCETIIILHDQNPQVIPRGTWVQRICCSKISVIVATLGEGRLVKTGFDVLQHTVLWCYLLLPDLGESVFFYMWVAITVDARNPQGMFGDQQETPWNGPFGRRVDSKKTKIGSDGFCRMFVQEFLGRCLVVWTWTLKHYR